MEKIRQRFSKIPPALFSAITFLVILWLTLVPKPLGDNTPILFPGADKVVHGLMFGFLADMMLFDWQRIHQWQLVTWGQATLFATLTSFLGIAIEFAQNFMDIGRSYEGADIVADILGSFIFAILWVLCQKFWCSKST